MMLQAMSLLERTGQGDYSKQRRMLRRRGVAAERQRLIWSLLPGKRGRRLSRALSRELSEVNCGRMAIESYEITFDEHGVVATRV